MSRVALIFILLMLSLGAGEMHIDFKETRYIDALNEKVTRSGFISFSNDSVKIYYAPPNEREVSLKDGQITIKSGGDVSVKEAKDEPNIAKTFTLFRALFEDDEQSLKKFFKVLEKSPKEVVLKSISSSNPISKLTYELKEGNITKLDFLGQNGDRITIDVVQKR
ncbi:MAG: hypothetical protein LBS73_03410 [Campylobacteraceae bacterium]|nr:hypothetical protein [Campylobacteraceae bacterium]